MNIRALVAEAVGTFILVGVGSYGVLAAGLSSLAPAQVVPFAFGLGLLVAIAAAGHVSGAYFNPAVTLAAVLDRRIDWKLAIGYVVAQVVGAFGASLTILLTVTPGANSGQSITGTQIVGYTRTVPSATLQLPDLSVFAIEAILTAIFVLVILTVTRKAPDLAILIIPFTLMVIHFVAVPLTGASVNPARSLAPAIVSNSLDSLWIYLTAPFLGAVVGWGVYKYLTPEDDVEEYEFEEIEGIEVEEIGDPAD